jgi:hypothetical protein
MRRELAFAVFVALIYFLSGTGVITHVDGVVNYALTRRMVDNATFSLDPSDPALTNNPEMVRGPDGTTYAHFNPGIPLLVAPLYIVGKTISPILPRMADLTAADFLVSTTNAFVTAFCVFLVIAIVRELGYSRRAGFLAGAAFGFGSLAWNYATTLFTEPATGACLLLSVLLLIHSRRREYPLALVFAAGLAAGAAVFMRVSGAVFLPGLALYILLAHRRSGKRLIWLLFAFAIGCAIFIAAIGWYNLVRFGSVLETGYTVGPNEFTGGIADRPQRSAGIQPVLYALYALLFSPGRGVFLYAPVLVLGLLGLPALARRRPMEAGLLVGLSGLLLVVEAALPFDYWFGGWSYGARYLLPVIGLGAICSAAWFDQISRSRHSRLIVAGVMSALVVLQLPTVLANVNVTYYRAQLATGLSTDRTYLVESWRASTYVGAWQQLGLVTGRVIHGDPTPRARLADLPDIAVALEGAEAFNTYQPWWLRLLQTARVTGVITVGLLVLVGATVLLAWLSLRLALRDGPRRIAGPAPQVGRVSQFGQVEHGDA